MKDCRGNISLDLRPMREHRESVCAGYAQGGFVAGLTVIAVSNSDRVKCFTHCSTRKVDAPGD